MSKHFAIGVGTEVSIWCEDLGTDQHGRQFNCLNGGWSGFIDADGKLNVEFSGKRHNAEIIWEGTVPPQVGDYNVAMPWITAQLLGSASKLYGEPHPEASTWFWRETEGNKAGAIRGSTEMEALDRLREAFPAAGAIEWQRRVSATWIEPEPVDHDEVAF